MTQDVTLKDVRGYDIGERNPKTLPDGTRESESPEENERSTRRIHRVACWAFSTQSNGVKY